jgi:hypothetical protein
VNKIRGLFVSVEQVLKHALKTGEVLATKETIGMRLDTCRDCEWLEGSRCMHCGCFVALKGGLLATRCPVGKW